MDACENMLIFVHLGLWNRSTEQETMVIFKSRQSQH